MRISCSLSMLSAALILSTLAGCATNATARTDALRCTSVGCIEPLDLALAGPGSTVLIVQCAEGVQTSRRYAHAPDGWRLQMYETGTSGTCTKAKSSP